jgi:hypothetical protein
MAIRLFGGRSLERSTLQSLHEYRQPVTVPPESLQAVGSLVDKDEQITRANVLAELTLHDRHQTIETLSHVDRTTMQIDVRAGDGWQSGVHHRPVTALSIRSIR